MTERRWGWGGGRITWDDACEMSNITCLPSHTLKGGICSAFEGNWLKFGQTLPALAARLGVLIIPSGAPLLPDPFCTHFHPALCHGRWTSVDGTTWLPYPVAPAWVWPMRGDQREGGTDSGLCSLFLPSLRECHVLAWAVSFHVCCWLGLPASMVPFLSGLECSCTCNLPLFFRPRAATVALIAHSWVFFQPFFSS